MIIIVTLIHAWLFYVVVLAVMQRVRRPEPPAPPRVAWDALTNDDLRWVHKHERLFD